MTAAPRCSSCECPDLRAVFELRAVPVLVCSFFADRESALACPRGDVSLWVCPACGLIENHDFDPERVVYGEGYENSLGFSELFQGYLRTLAEDLVERHELTGARVAEIGCGDGEFLSLLCELGASEGLGFDPSYPTDRPAELAGGRARVVRDVFRPAPGTLTADLVVCRQVLEHVAAPRRFLEDVRAALEPGARPGVVFEVPNTLDTLARTSLWDVIYEHRTYFTAGSLTRMFEAAGFEVTGAVRTYADQYVAVEARPRGADGHGTAAPRDVDTPEEVVAAAGRFRAASQERVEGWRTRLAEARAAGRRVALWGAGARGVSFLNVADPGGTVTAVVDLNDDKHGRHVAGTGQQVQAPESLVAAPPDLMVVTNPIYQDEIRAALRVLGLEPQIALA